MYIVDLKQLMERILNHPEPPVAPSYVARALFRTPAAQAAPARSCVPANSTVERASRTHMEGLSRAAPPPR